MTNAIIPNLDDLNVLNVLWVDNVEKDNVSRYNKIKNSGIPFTEEYAMTAKGEYLNDHVRIMATSISDIPKLRALLVTV